jgi:hypothetical protein
VFRTRVRSVLVIRDDQKFAYKVGALFALNSQ